MNTTAEMAKKSAVHPTAIVHPNAQLGDGVSIGPYCIIGEHAKIGDRTRCHSHIVIDGFTTIGTDCEIFPFTTLGTIPQDLKYNGEQSQLIIGNHNKIREHVTMNPGTSGGNLITQVGNHCLFMVGTHVAHDCIIHDHVILANNATLAGHVILEDHVIIGGLSAVQQFVRIGKHAMIGGTSGVENDVIPFGLVMGDRSSLCGLNLVGLKRRGFKRDDIFSLRQAYKLLFKDDGTLHQRLDNTTSIYSDNQLVMDIIEFIRADSPRGLTLCKDGKNQGA